MKTLSFLLVLAASAAAQTKPSIELSVTPEREALHPKSDPETILQVEIKAKPSEKKRRTPLNLAIVLDRSGSMTGAKIEKARQAACMAVDRLGKDDFLSLVVYDTDVRVLVPPQKVGDGLRIKEAIQAIEPGGSTALYEGVQRGAAEVRACMGDERINRVLLLSDGLANVGPSSPRALAELGKALETDGISVSTIGLGEDYNEDLMTALAEASRANYYYVRDAEKLPGIFAEELGLAQSVVARKVSLVIRLASGVKPVDVLGEDGAEFDHGMVRIPVEDLSSGQTRRFLVRCKVPRDAEKSVDLGSVTLGYDDVDLGEARIQNATARVEIAKNQEESAASIQGEVAQNAAITCNRLAKERAIALADEGRAAEAAQVLETQSAVNSALPSFAVSDQLRREESILRQAVGSLQSNGGFSKTERKAIEFQNYQDRRQKER